MQLKITFEPLKWWKRCYRKINGFYNKFSYSFGRSIENVDSYWANLGETCADDSVHFRNSAENSSWKSFNKVDISCVLNFEVKNIIRCRVSSCQNCCEFPWTRYNALCNILLVEMFLFVYSPYLLYCLLQVALFPISGNSRACSIVLFLVWY